MNDGHSSMQTNAADDILAGSGYIHRTASPLWNDNVHSNPMLQSY